MSYGLCPHIAGVPRHFLKSRRTLQVIGDPKDLGWVGSFHPAVVTAVFKNEKGNRRYEVEYEEVSTTSRPCRLQWRPLSCPGFAAIASSIYMCC
jgi:hypothetical protein